MTVIFDDAGHATVAGNIRVFHYVAETGEYWTWSEEFIPVGVSIPGNSTLIDPGEDIAGYVWVFDGSAWESKEDHRGDTIYSTDTGAESIVKYIGGIKEGFTQTAPGTAYDKWDGTQWVTDTDAKHAADVAAAAQKRSVLRAIADDEIAWLQDAVDAEISTDEEALLLAEWKKYRVLLMRVNTENPIWPDSPTS